MMRRAMNKQSAFCLAVLLMAGGSAMSQGVSGQGGEIRPGENLVVQGVPAIPASLADEVRRYTESRSASFADWHPTERSMLIATRFANTTQIHRVKQPGGARPNSRSSTSRSTRPRTSPEPAGTSCSPRTWAATNSTRSIATTWRTAGSRCSPTAAARKTAASSGAPAATGSPTARPAATGPTATSTSWTRSIRRPTGSSWKSAGAAGPSSTGRPTTGSC